MGGRGIPYLQQERSRDTAESASHSKSSAQNTPPAQSQSSSQSSANSPAPTETVDLEVEISDRWPLKAPQGPTGMACSGTGSELTGISLQRSQHGRPADLRLQRKAYREVDPE